MMLVMTPVSTKTGIIPACIASSTICDVCSLIKLSGLRQGTNTDDLFVHLSELGKTVVMASPSILTWECAPSPERPKVQVCPEVFNGSVVEIISCESK